MLRYLELASGMTEQKETSETAWVGPLSCLRKKLWPRGQKGLPQGKYHRAALSHLKSSGSDILWTWELFRF